MWLGGSLLDSQAARPPISSTYHARSLKAHSNRAGETRAPARGPGRGRVAADHPIQGLTRRRILAGRSTNQGGPSAHPDWMSMFQIFTPGISLTPIFGSSFQAFSFRSFSFTRQL